MKISANVGDIAHIIQLSVAPVFLLTGVGTILNVMTNRLGRIIDRARRLEERLEGGHPDEEDIRRNLDTLSLRAKLIGRAITLCTATALLVCMVIAVLFLGDFLNIEIPIVVAGLFILAMLLLVFGLVWFLREIFLATARLRIGPGEIGR
ncbi:MAG TPA: DUF2721 domain-containing protein [Verrucomicrobiae bacterium]|nr:DUF2721 domain-containing protein [Verrucomicrobiae bacterium]